jgi:hypothetical protein
MINVRCLGLVVTLFLTVQVANAQWVIGRYAGEFLSLGAGARALAMGGASIASPLPATAGYYNPAGLAGVNKRSVEFMHASQFDNLFTYDYLSYAAPMQRGMSGALTILYSRVGDIPLTRLADPTQPLSDGNRVEVDGQTGDHEWAAIASGGKMLGNGWNAGASAKILTKSVASETAVGLGFDLGVRRAIGSRAEFGAVVRDITTSTMAWSTGRTESILPTVGFRRQMVGSLARDECRYHVSRRCRNKIRIARRSGSDFRRSGFYRTARRRRIFDFQNRGLARWFEWRPLHGGSRFTVRQSGGSCGARRSSGSRSDASRFRRRRFLIHQKVPLKTSTL